jgi:hypothetical protein
MLEISQTSPKRRRRSLCQQPSQHDCLEDDSQVVVKRCFAVLDKHKLDSDHQVITALDSVDCICFIFQQAKVVEPRRYVVLEFGSP